MSPQTFIFIGRSGCGKGTQAKLLEAYLKKIDASNKVLYIQTGEEIREFIKGEGYTQKLDKILYDKGDLQPEFLAVYMWTNLLVNRFEGREHLIFDGAPRKFHEAGVLNSIFDFYKLGKCFVINIDISEEESMRRLLLRKRIDDNEKEIKRRLDWYETDVLPTLDYFKDNPNYSYIVIGGERPVDVIHEDIVKSIALQ